MTDYQPKKNHNKTHYQRDQKIPLPKEIHTSKSA